jgi:hypothetical protein
MLIVMLIEPGSRGGGLGADVPGPVPAVVAVPRSGPLRSNVVPGGGGPVLERRITGGCLRHRTPGARESDADGQ